MSTFFFFHAQNRIINSLSISLWVQIISFTTIHTQSLLSTLKNPKWIVSNSPLCHVQSVIEALGLQDIHWQGFSQL